MKSLGFILILLLAAAVETIAEKPPVHVWAYGEDSSILLRWTPPPDNPLPKNGYVVLRKKKGSAMTPQIVGTTTVDSGIISRNFIDKSTEQVMSTIRRQLRNPAASPQEKRLLGWELSVFLSAKPDVVFPTLGLEFRDTSIRKDIEYEYTIAIENDDIGFEKSAASNKQTILEPPTTIAAERQMGGIALRWETQTATADGIARWEVARADSTGKNPIIIGTVYPVVVGDNPLVCFFDPSEAEALQSAYFIVPYSVFGSAGKPSKLVFGASAPQLLPSPFIVSVRADRNMAVITWIYEHNPTGFHIYRVNSGVQLLVGKTNGGTRTFADSAATIDGGGIISYTICAVDHNGREGRFSEARQGFIADSTPPQMPRFVVAQGEPNAIVLQWTSVQNQDAAGYEVSRSTRQNGTFRVLNNSPQTDTLFRDTTAAVTDGSLWWYRIRTVDVSGNRSPWTEAAPAKLPDAAAPPTPVISAIGSGDRAITLYWERSPITDLLGYWVNRTDDTLFTSVTLNTKLLPPSQTAFKDSTALPSVIYFYELVSVDSSMNFSEPSRRYAMRSYDSQMPQAPILDSIYISKSGILITWFWEYPPVVPLNVVVERSRDGSRYVQISPLLSHTERSFTDLDGEAGERYYYRLRSRNQEGNWSKPTSAKIY